MGVGQVWNRALVYFGIVEENEVWDDEYYDAEEELERTYNDRPNVRRINEGRSSRRSGEFEDWSEPEAAGPDRGRTAVLRPPRRSGRPGLEAVASANVKVHLVVPKSFNDAQSIADRFKDATPVILNLQGADTELSKRLIDFSSGLTYALNGGMQRIADKVFLLTPQNVEVSAEESARLIERSGFYNQS